MASPVLQTQNSVPRCARLRPSTTIPEQSHNRLMGAVMKPFGEAERLATRLPSDLYLARCQRCGWVCQEDTESVFRSATKTFAQAFAGPSCGEQATET